VSRKDVSSLSDLTVQRIVGLGTEDGESLHVLAICPAPGVVTCNGVEVWLAEDWRYVIEDGA
jgi:hypothetical protein